MQKLHMRFSHVIKRFNPTLDRNVEITFLKSKRKVVGTLISARLKAGLKQSELAEIVGKDQSYISNIERGQRRVDMLEFYILAKAMNVDPVSLYASAIEHFPESFEI